MLVFYKVSGVGKLSPGKNGICLYFTGCFRYNLLRGDGVCSHRNSYPVALGLYASGLFVIPGEYNVLVETTVHVYPEWCQTKLKPVDCVIAYVSYRKRHSSPVF